MKELGEIEDLEKHKAKLAAEIMEAEALIAALEHQKDNLEKELAGAKAVLADAKDQHRVVISALRTAREKLGA
jgi:hypothetical protein